MISSTLRCSLPIYSLPPSSSSLAYQLVQFLGGRSQSASLKLDQLSGVRSLATWQRDVTSGRRQRPAMKPVAPHRPTIPDRLKRDIHIQFTIGLLERLGIPPYGTDFSGCRIVSEALRELSDGAVERIWKECTWKEGAFEDVMRKYSKPIAERSGLYPH